jgi:hypothetical protein
MHNNSGVVDLNSKVVGLAPAQWRYFSEVIEYKTGSSFYDTFSIGICIWFIFIGSAQLIAIY